MAFLGEGGGPSCGAVASACSTAPARRWFGPKMVSPDWAENLVDAIEYGAECQRLSSLETDFASFFWETGLCSRPADRR